MSRQRLNRAPQVAYLQHFAGFDDILGEIDSHYEDCDMFILSHVNRGHYKRYHLIINIPNGSKPELMYNIQDTICQRGYLSLMKWFNKMYNNAVLTALSTLRAAYKPFLIKCGILKQIHTNAGSNNKRVYLSH